MSVAQQPRRLRATGPPSEFVLRMRGVTKEYGVVAALRGIDLDIRRGELCAIAGPSGSGKSTLLHIAGTLDRPTAGTVHVAGHDISVLDDRELSALRAGHIGFVFQQFFLIEHATALDNVADGLLYTGRSLRERRALALEALIRVGLAERTNHRAAQLSGGERQRVAIARAIVGRPSFVLADEPTGNLDSASSDTIVGLLEELNREGTTIAVITHNPDLAAHLPRRIGIRDGHVDYDER